jgi:hypothetical protein
MRKAFWNRLASSSSRVGAVINSSWAVSRECRIALILPANAAAPRAPQGRM